ncbi:MAG: right-handed parallel beta-helix repeat-containing protein [Ignavibacteria bacterium]|nr:right-handed parallel beta-helix repeat-containing protein [Ignavibacteria bacterium]
MKKNLTTAIVFFSLSLALFYPLENLQADVYVNRVLGPPPGCPYSIQEYHVTSETWDASYQNAYGICAGLPPGPPFILEHNLIVDQGGSLTIIGPGVVSVPQIFIVGQGATLTIVSADITSIQQISILGNISCISTNFSSSTGLARLIHIQTPGYATFEGCEFNFANSAPGQEGIIGSAATTDTTSISFIDCEFNFLGSFQQPFMELGAGVVEISNCTFSDADGTALASASTNLILNDNRFLNTICSGPPIPGIITCGAPVNILGSVGSLTGNVGVNNEINAIVMGFVSLAENRLSTWSGSDSLPFINAGTIYIYPGDSLNISTGTILKSENGPHNVAVDGGVLNAEGVLFTSNNDTSAAAGGNTGSTSDPGPGDWGQISVTAVNGPSPRGEVNLNNCIVRYAGRGGSHPITQGPKSSLQVTNCLIEQNMGNTLQLTSGFPADLTEATVRGNTIGNNTGPAIWMYDTSPGNTVIDSNTIIGNASGIRIIGGSGGSSAPVSRNLISGNDGYGISCFSSGYSPFIVNNVISANRLIGFYQEHPTGDSIRIINNTIYGNGGDGIRLQRLLQSIPPAQVVNNLITENQGYGIYEMVSSTNSIPRHNDFFDNADGLFFYNGSTSLTLSEINQLPGAANNLSANPIIAAQPQGVSSNITVDPVSGTSILTDMSASFVPDTFIQNTINPNLNQKRQFLIIDNDATTLTVYGLLTDVASIGDNYSIITLLPVHDSPQIIDVGENRPDLPPTDFLGNARIINAIVDIGAVEIDTSVNFTEDLTLDVPKEFVLLQNYPNPFNPVTTINYLIPELSFVTIKVFDVLGSEVTILINEEKTIGNYEVEFNAATLPSGVYFYQLKAGNYIETRKMVLLR